MHTNIQPMHIGQVIRQIREARKATLEEIAFVANTNASNLSRIERGRQGYSAEALERIAQALGVTVAELHVEAETATGAGLKSASGNQNQRTASALTAKYVALSPDNRALTDEFIALLLRRQRTPGGLASQRKSPPGKIAAKAKKVVPTPAQKKIVKTVRTSKGHK